MQQTNIIGFQKGNTHFEIGIPWNKSNHSFDALVEEKQLNFQLFFPWKSSLNASYLLFKNPNYMTKLQIEICWDETARVQKQYALFFPESQKQYICLQEKDGGHQLVFLEGYELPGVITLGWGDRLLDN